jgi:sulfate adenylyltransferase
MDDTSTSGAAQAEGLTSDQVVAQVVAEAVAQSVGVLPDELAALPSVHAEGAALDLVELVLAGILDIGFTLPSSTASRPPLLPVALAVPPGEADAVAAAGRVALEDSEGVPVALLAVTATEPDPGTDSGLLAAGGITGLRPLSHGPFRRLRLTPDEVAALPQPPGLVVTTARPLITDDLAVVSARSAGRPVLVLALVGHGRRAYPGDFGLVRALRATVPELPDSSLVVPVPLPLTDRSAPFDAELREAVARAYGATETLHLSSATVGELDWLVEQGSSLTEGALAVLRAQRPALARRGVVLFFTGLSGSGKSTVAKGVAEVIQESTDRTVTMLDGDVVRRNLSKGLGFSRADRDTNIRRIGFVAAEAARHGGIALCAPIAPYAATRAAVRTMVENAGAVFLLVHVSTPLEVCEARDRKGLYARARAGLIPEFTGVSDPYEEPSDADLRIDTSAVEVGAAVDVVLAELRNRGLVPSVRREDT